MARKKKDEQLKQPPKTIRCIECTELSLTFFAASLRLIHWQQGFYAAMPLSVKNQSPKLHIQEPKP
mgnify:FL=1|jgi:hypothetical protein